MGSGGSAVSAILASEYNSAMDAVSWSTRSLIKAAPGHRLLAVDFANIEGRVLAMLAEESWKLQAFRDYDTLTGEVDEKGKAKRKGPDLYLVAAGKILGKKPEAVTKPERQNVGKPAELGLGFGGGVGAILTMMRNGAVIPWMHRDGPAPNPVTLDDIAGSVRPAVSPVLWSEAAAQYGRGAYESATEIMEQRRLERLVAELQGDEDLPDDDDETQRLAEEIAKANRLGLSVDHWTALRVVVDLWRQNNGRIAMFWRDLEDAALAAIRSPGRTISAGPHIRYLMHGDILYCRLPSGRPLAYPYARILKPKDEKSNWKGERISYMRRVNGRKNQWIWKDTYGGSLAENVTQATARDVLRDALLRLRKAGYRTVLHVHDEIVCEMPIGRGSLNELSEIMRTIPKWAEGLPVATDGWEGLRYRK